MSDKLVFAEEPDSANAKAEPWKILIVDDENDVHDITRLALDGFEYAGKKLKFISAYSGEEAKQIVSKQNDIALILLDVVMETDRAGLDVAQYIRQTLDNKLVRIILRTGKGAEDPEYDTITKYDINDYKHKTELTQSKLYTTVYTILSSYREILAREDSLKGLKKVIDASANVFEIESMNEFTEGVLEQLASLLFLNHDAMFVESSSMALEKKNSSYVVIAGIGKFEIMVGQEISQIPDTTITSRIGEALKKKHSILEDDYFTGYYLSPDNVEHILYVTSRNHIYIDDVEMLEMFIRNVAIAEQKIKIFNTLKEKQSTLG